MANKQSRALSNRNENEQVRKGQNRKMKTNENAECMCVIQSDTH